MFSIVLAALLLIAAWAGPARGAPDLVPIPGHPPVTVSGALQSVDTKLGTITFEDGRTVMLSQESEVLVPASIDRVKPGIPIVVRNALPVRVESKSQAGAP